MSSETCPICGSGYVKVIHGGFPMKLCVDDRCNCIWGGWAWWLNVIPFTGWLMTYEGSYWSALYYWLCGEAEK